MNHRKQGRKLERNRSQRSALVRTLLGSLVINERITTTQAKAKELKRIFDRIVIIAKQSQNDKVAVLRKLHRRLPVVAAQKLCSDEFLQRFSSRTSGFTRMSKIPPRKSDNAEMIVIECV